jgi:hypothetical protein
MWKWIGISLLAVAMVFTIDYFNISQSRMESLIEEGESLTASNEERLIEYLDEKTGIGDKFDAWVYRQNRIVQVAVALGLLAFAIVVLKPKWEHFRFGCGFTFILFAVIIIYIIAFDYAMDGDEYMRHFMYQSKAGVVTLILVWPLVSLIIALQEAYETSD